MDLPISRIAQGNLKQTPGGLDIVDCVFNQKLVSLDCTRAIPGDYVVLARDGDELSGMSYVFTITSDYEFETLNRRALFKAIETKLGEVGIAVFELGILLEIMPGVFDVRRRAIRTARDHAGKCHYEMVTMFRGDTPIQAVINSVKSNWA